WNGGDQSLVLEYFVRYYMPLVNIVRLILFFLIYRLAINKFKRQLKWISALKIAALLIIFLFSTDIIDDNEYFLAFFTSTFFQIFNKVLIVLPEFILLMIAYKLHFNKDRDLNIEIEAI
ncbi:MAG: hypothetical protein NT150_09650, partial [Bacteroidetes bacterium]|nr:hypothetical protein [Bacteroidota bacterium]